MRTSRLFVLAIASIAALGAGAWCLRHAPVLTPTGISQEDERKELDSPDEAMAWRRMAWLDQNGNIAPGAQQRALAQRAALVRPQMHISGDQWSEMGPDDVAGRTRALLIHPANPLVMWIGTAGGGVWKTVDGGNTWNPASEQFGTLSVATLAMDPANPNVIYAGTGEGYFNQDAIHGTGIYKSIDGGDTWSHLSGTEGMVNVNKISICPTNSNLLLVGTVDSNSFVNGGVWRSTDGGASWNQVLSARTGQSVQFVPNSPNIALAVTGVSNGSNDLMTVNYSTDGGASWHSSAGLTNLSLAYPGRIEVRAAPSSTNIVYALDRYGNVYKSTDTAATFAQISTIGGYGNQGWYDNDIWVSPTDPNLLCAAGVAVYRSTDGGLNFGQISNGYIQTDQPHPDVQFITNAPGYDGVNNRTVFVCTDGGVWRATDITTASTNGGWTRLDRTARVTQFYSVAGDGPTGKVVGGTQDNGTQMLLPGSMHALPLYGGDGGFVAVDPTDPTVSYNEYVYLRINRNNGGIGFNASTPIYYGLTDTSGTANFIAPFILDPNRHKVILAGGWQLWRCDDATVSQPQFYVIRPGMGNQADRHGYISAIAVAKGNSDLIYVGYNDGRIYMTTNGTAAAPIWTAVDDNVSTDPLPNRMVTRIMIDPANPSLIHVCLGGYTSDNLWRSLDGGATWASRTGTGSGVLPQVPIRTIVRDPSNGNLLTVGTEVGVFSSSDAGNTWSTTNDAPANVAVDELAYLNNSTTLVAGTHGRGIWVLKRSMLSGISFASPQVSGGNSLTGTVTLRDAAPGGGVKVALSSSSASAMVSTSVNVPGGASSAKFTVNTVGVASDTPVTITATQGGGSVTGSFTIVPPALGSFTLSPPEVAAHSSSIGTVTLNGPAPDGGMTVKLSSSDRTVATVPGSITLPAGSTTANFVVTTQDVTAKSTAKITASTTGYSNSAVLTVDPVKISSMSVTPASGYGGIVTPTLHVNLSPAPGTDVTLAIGSDATGVIPKTKVTILRGATTGSVALAPRAVDADQIVTLSTSLAGVPKSVAFTVRTAVLTSVTSNRTEVVGGSGQPLTATIKLSSPAGPGGKVVTLQSSDSSVVVPASVTFGPGKSSMSVALTHSLVGSLRSVSLTGALDSATKTAKITVVPYIQWYRFSSATLTGGTSAYGTVILAAPAPAGGFAIDLSSSNPCLTVPSSVSVAAGASSGKFLVTTTPVPTDTAVTISGTHGVDTATAKLTVLAPVLVSANLNRTSVTGGSSKVVTLTVNLGSAAPAAGMVVKLSSSNAAAAKVPGNVTVPAGAKSATVTVSHFKVDASTSVTLSATLKGVTKSAALTVNP